MIETSKKQRNSQEGPQADKIISEHTHGRVKEWTLSPP